MTTAEFQAWLEGFIESMGREPSRADLERIRERAGELEQPAGQTPFYPPGVRRTPGSGLFTKDGDLVHPTFPPRMNPPGGKFEQTERSEPLYFAIGPTVLQIDNADGRLEPVSNVSLRNDAPGYEGPICVPSVFGTRDLDAD